MEILNSTEYVDLKKQKESWYQLNVINQWDWSTKPVCFQELPDGHLIKFCLKKYTPLTDKMCQGELVEELTEEMRTALDEMGYIIAKK